MTKSKCLSAKEFYLALLLRNIDLDFVNDFDGSKTIEEWITYTIQTLIDVNNDLYDLGDYDCIINNCIAITQLAKFKEAL